MFGGMVGAVVGTGALRGWRMTTLNAYQAGGASWNGTRDERNPVVISDFDSGLGSAVAGQSGSGRTIRTCSGSGRETPTSP
jgi:hypothetical protein